MDTERETELKSETGTAGRPDWLARWRGDTVDASDAELREILATTRTIAVVGIKNQASEDACRIPLYMQEQGYRILPVNPKLESAIGVPAVAVLGALDEPVDLVSLFRASDHIPRHVEEILAMSPRPKAVWMQLGIHNGAASAALRAAGIHVVQDRCIMVDHKRLLGEGASPAPLP